MNRIFKVIWSKTKHCYVVVSEYAKANTKAAHTSMRATAAALAAAAVLLAPVDYSTAWAQAAQQEATVKDTSDMEQTVYTKEGTDKQIEQKLAAQKTDKALHVTNDGKLIVGTNKKQQVKDIAIRGQLTSGSVSTGNITATGDAKVAGKVEAEAVYDDTTKPGNYVVQTNSVGSNLSVLDTQVKANADAVATKANAADVYTKTETDSKVDAVKKEATTYTYRKVAAEEAARKAADNELNERITNEAKAIHDEIKAGDTALDTRITNVKEYLENQTSENYVSKTDAAVQDGAIVKAAKTIGENVTNLDAALAKETAARIGADAAQDKVIEQVNHNMVDGFNTINKNMADGFTALNNADLKEAQERAAADTALDDKITAETSARVAADTKLVEAVNSGLSLGDDNVLQKNTTTIDAQGNVTTSKTDANEMILNKGKDNQITLNEKGIKAGTNSSVMDKDGVYTGGDTFDAAKAAMKSDGQIKGANGKFTVDASGNTSVTSLDAGTGTIQTKGDLYAKDATFSGDITAKDATLSGDLSAKDGTFSGDLSAKDGTFSGDVSAKDVTATGTLQGAEVTDGTATLKQGKLTGVKDIETEALHVNGDANVTGKLTTKDLEVTGEFNANTLKSRLDENNYTEIHGGNVTSKNLKVDKGVIRTSESSFDENGREEYVTDNDSRATVKVGANEISQTLDDKGDTSEKQSTFRQRIDQILQEIKSANGSTSVEQTDVNITNTAKNGTITNDAQNLVNKASDSITSQIGDGSAVKSVMDANGIANTATGGTISNSAADVINTGTNSVINQVGDNQVAVKTDSVKAAYGSDTSTTWDAKGITNTTSGDISNSAANISNTTTGNMTNTVGGNLIDTIMGTSTTTVTGKVTEDYKSDLSTKVGGDEAHAVTGNQTTTVSGNRTVNVKGTETENFNAQVTSIKTNQRTSVGGNQTNIVGGDQQNTVSGSKTETVKGSVTEKYGSQATTVDGDQSTNIGGNQTTVVAKDQTNTVSGNKTETVKGAVNETYGSQTTKVNGDQSTTVTGKQTNSITGDQVNTIGGNQTTTVTGNVTEDYKVDLSTKVGGNETHAVTGNQTVTVSKDRTVNVKGTETENFNAQVTNVKTDQRTSVGGNQTNIVAGNQQNTVSGSKTETVKGSVTEKYGSQATTVDGDQSTNVGGNQSNVVAGDQTNTISGSKTESVKGAVTETYGSQSTTVNGNQSNTVKGTLTETVTGDVTEDYKANLSTKVGGNQTTTVTGDSSLSAKNITNTASEKITNQIGDGSAVKSEMTADGITNTAKGGTIYNKSKDILNEASGDILNFADGEIGNSATKITNLTGDNTVTSDTNGTTFENKAHSTAVKEGTFTKTTISGNTITTGEAIMDYADVMKDLGVRGNAAVDGNTTLGKEDAETTLTVNSTSTFKKDVTMKENATVEKNLTVNGQSTFNNKVTITNGGLDVTGGTQTDTLHVTGASNFDGMATFKDIVKMEKDLSVGGNATVTGDVTASSYKVGDKTYIDANGINANGQKITNLAAGTEDSDAANYGQLRKVETRVDGVENRVTNVENRVDKMDSRIDKVGANAAAMANLHPLEFDEDSKWNVAAAVGNYKGETAAAVGAFYRPNEDVMFNLSTTFGNDENMVGGGLSLRLGKGGNREKDKKLKAAIAENNDLRAKVDDLTARMDALLSVINPNMSKEFPDVPENHWAYEAVTRLAGNNIVEGYEDGKFHGERTMTRYEMAEIIYNALSKGAKAEKKLVEEFKPELQAMAAQKQAK